MRTGPSRTEFREFPMPEIAPDSALMKMAVAGISRRIRPTRLDPHERGDRVGVQRIGAAGVRELGQVHRRAEVRQQQEPVLFGPPEHAAR